MGRRCSGTWTPTGTCVSTAGIAPGTHTVTVTYAGDAGVQGSSVTGSITVAKANSSTLLTPSPNPSTFGQNVTFTATVVAVAPGGGVPTGTVTFTISGGPTLVGTPNGAGQATASTSALTAGPHTVTATYDPGQRGHGCHRNGDPHQRHRPLHRAHRPDVHRHVRGCAGLQCVDGLGSAGVPAAAVAPVGRHVCSPAPDRRPARVQLRCSGVRGDVPARCCGGPSGG
ncbi:Ig-like domain-containing protein [Streptomyces cangkringensis]|uniref:Ig-like domain-containing protein n=1 Tax=Streptomyces violaceusniger group TaxID=2839105 RepID=UPI003CD06BDD